MDWEILDLSHFLKFETFENVYAVNIVTNKFNRFIKQIKFLINVCMKRLLKDTNSLYMQGHICWVYDVLHCRPLVHVYCKDFCFALLQAHFYLLILILLPYFDSIVHTKSTVNISNSWCIGA